MSLQAWAVAAIVIGAMALFVSEKLRYDVIGLLVLTALIVSGILTPAEGLSGFSNEATVVVAAMFALNAGLVGTGALDPLIRTLSRIQRPWLLTLSILVIVCFLGAFVKNTALVATFLPVTLSVCARAKTSPARVLIPMSYAAQMGGVCTLLGTSSNLLTNSLAVQHGMPEFGVFDFTRLGVVLAIAGIVYLMLIGRWLLPRHIDTEHSENLELGKFVTELRQLRRESGLVVLSERGDSRATRRKAPLAIGILAAVVVVAGLGILPIVASALVGCVVMALTGCFSFEDVYEAMDWKVVVLLGAILPLGIALDKTGLAHEVVGAGMHLVGAHGPLAVLLMVYLLTALLTEMMGHNPSVVLMVPIAISVAHVMQVNPTPFVICVAFAAATSFATPVGYPTNTMVYAAGSYRFTDFMKVGIPLIAMFCALSMWLIPHLWPFHP